MRRRFIDRTLLLLGGVFVIGGQYTLTYFDYVEEVLGGRIGDVGRAVMCLLHDLLPCAVPLGLLAVGLGALLVASTIGLPPYPATPALSAAPGLASQPRARRRVIALISIAVGLALLGSVLSIRTQLGTWPLWLWLATFLVPIPAMIIVDRVRRTPFGSPFPQRWEWAMLLLIVALDLMLVGHDMTHWRWAGTPDETSFFGVAKSIVIGTSQRALLSEGGVFTFQPVLSACYQAMFMWVFGVNIFAWKLSSAVALAGALPFTYLFARQLWNRRTAFMAILFFGTAQLAVGYSHFGYNNVQVYLIVAGALGVLAWAHTRQSLLGYYIAGCIAGIGFYTYYTARVVAPLLFLLIWSCDGFPLARKARTQTLALALGLGLTILPVFSDVGTLLHNMLEVAMTGEQASTLSATVSRVLEHWFLSIVHGLWFPGPHHFQTNPIVDPISGTLAVVGFWLCVGGLRHRPNARFLAPAYLLSAFVVGATSPHLRPPLTRLLFLAPLTATLAAVGADQLLRAMKSSGTGRQRIVQITGGLLVLASMAWNIATVEYNMRYRFHGYGTGTTSELIRMVQQLPTPCRIIFVQRTDSEFTSVSGVMEEYGIDTRFDYCRGIDAKTMEVLQTAQPPFALFCDLTDTEQITAVEGVMAQRFAAGVWRASDPGQPWNLRYFDVSGADLGGAG